MNTPTMVVRMSVQPAVSNSASTTLTSCPPPFRFLLRRLALSRSFRAAALITFSSTAFTRFAIDSFFFLPYASGAANRGIQFFPGGAGGDLYKRLDAAGCAHGDGAFAAPGSAAVHG